MLNSSTDQKGKKKKQGNRSSEHGQGLGYKRMKKQPMRKENLKNLQKAWRASAHDHFKITRQSRSLESKYKKMNGTLYSSVSNSIKCL